MLCLVSRSLLYAAVIQGRPLTLAGVKGNHKLSNKGRLTGHQNFHSAGGRYRVRLAKDSTSSALEALRHVPASDSLHY